MATAVILAIAVVVVVLGVGALFYFRGSNRGGTATGQSPETAPRGRGDAGTPRPTAKPPPKAPKTPKAPKPPKAPRRKRQEPSEADVAAVVDAAEAILQEAHERGGDDRSGDGDGDASPDTGVGLLDHDEPPPDDDPPPSIATAVIEEEDDEAGVAAEVRRPSFRDRLSRTRRAIGDRIADIRLRRKVDDEVWEELEEALILADVGADLSLDLVERARRRAADAKVDDADGVLAALKTEMVDALVSHGDRHLRRSDDGPTVWLVVGVNGTGKTTTIGKIANFQAREGVSVVLAAADTFRAAAADQLGVWAERAGAELVKGQEGSDPGAVVFDAVSFTRARDLDLLLVDTAGRLHTKVNLMEELKKIRRVAENAGGTPDEVLLVLDATTGQNGLSQARQFADAAGVTGVVLTKLDGTA
ncbi:MAG: signal recognition particle-docking protein FtsY, partial [Acidimicrobiia bacterium]|nr:signal recognition particle-docking protein FtsY [Acidimicrobiia bacterium]